MADQAKQPAPATASAPTTNAANALGTGRLRVGLVGCGGRGTGAAIDACHADPSVQLVSLGDLFPDRLAKCRNTLADVAKQEPALADRIKITDDKCFTGFDAYQKVIDAGVDYVLLCTPPGFRPMQFQAAVDAGKHVFVEKPVAADPAGVRAFIQTAEQAKKKNLGVLSGTVFRHHTTHRDAIAQIHSGQFGKVIGGVSYYNVGYLWSHPRQPEWSDLEYQIRNWLYFTWLSGDLIVEQNIHRLDITNWILKSTPISAYGMGGRQVRTDPAFGYIYDHFAVEYEYPDGVKVTNTCRQIDGCDTRVTEYYATSSGTILEPSKGPKTGKRTKPEPLGEAYVREHRDLIESVKAGAPLNEGKQVAESTLTAIMGRMSAYTGKTVTWDQAMNSTLDLWPKQPLAFGPMPVPPVPMPGKDPLV
jgi:predicted dehydrogenase